MGSTGFAAFPRSHFSPRRKRYHDHREGKRVDLHIKARRPLGLGLVKPHLTSVQNAAPFQPSPSSLTSPPPPPPPGHSYCSFCVERERERVGRIAARLWGGIREEEAGMEVMTHASTFLLPSLPPSRGGRPSPTYALVVLNQSLPSFAPLLWKHAQLRVCADGGANRVHDEMPLMFPHEDPLNVRKRYKPDVIKGDMDSIREDVKEFYSNLGTRIVDESHDQDTTDLHKCVAFVCDCTPDLDKSNLCILVAGALGGRFDHEVGNINVLYRFSNIRIILLSDDCLIYLLPKTHHHEILVQSSVEGPHCGLIPVGAPSASTTTTGLQWDLNDMGMNFGGLISTSNIVRGEKVTVHSDSDLLWTISIRRPT